MARKDKRRGSDYRAITYPGYLHLPTALTAELDFISLSGSALKLLIDIARQYNGQNNGDLCCSMSLMKERGWSSNSLLLKAKRELIGKNMILEARMGGMGIGPSLYAITWQPINECQGKGLDVSPTTTAPRALRFIPSKKSKRPPLMVVRTAPNSGAGN